MGGGCRWLTLGNVSGAVNDPWRLPRASLFLPPGRGGLLAVILVSPLGTVPVHKRLRHDSRKETRAGNLDSYVL